MYKVELRRNAQKSLYRLPAQDRRRIIPTLLNIEQEPRPKDVEKVRGTELWRLREGDYRLVYRIDDKVKFVTVVRIGRRRDVYRGI